MSDNVQLNSGTGGGDDFNLSGGTGFQGIVLVRYPTPV